jgi:hypothetical protein
MYYGPLATGEYDGDEQNRTERDAATDSSLFSRCGPFPIRDAGCSDVNVRSH